MNNNQRLQQDKKQASNKRTKKFGNGCEELIEEKDGFFNNYTDEELILMIRSGDDSPFDSLFLRYRPLVKKLIHSYYLYGYENDDFFQEARVVFNSAIQKYDKDRGLSFGNYYKLMLKHHLFSLIRKDTAKKRRAAKFSESLEALIETGKFPLTSFSGKDFSFQETLEVKETIPEYFSSLSELEHQVFTLYLSSKGTDLIAEELCCEELQVVHALDRCKRKMKQYFNS